VTVMVLIVEAEDYDALVLTGGMMRLWNLRNNENARAHSMEWLRAFSLYLFRQITSSDRRSNRNPWILLPNVPQPMPDGRRGEGPSSRGLPHTRHCARSIRMRPIHVGGKEQQGG